VASSADGTKLVAVGFGLSDPEVSYIYTSADSGASWTQTGPRVFVVRGVVG